MGRTILLERRQVNLEIKCLTTFLRSGICVVAHPHRSPCRKLSFAEKASQHALEKDYGNPRKCDQYYQIGDFIALGDRFGKNVCAQEPSRSLWNRPFLKFPSDIHWCAKIKDEVEKLAYQLNEEAERTERPIRRLSKVMYGSTCADMQVDVMGECLSSIKHVVGVRSVFLAKRLHAV
ncbi:uncharacterized protein TNCV_439401 [Trichonephila clavipes]|nr:uncharacterized protein TNCV_439401 [Trichonephila clavipes]